MERFRTPGLIALAVVILGLGSWQFAQSRSRASSAAPADDTEAATIRGITGGEVEVEDVTATVSVMLDYGDGRIQTYPDVATDDPTVLGAIRAASRDATVPFALEAAPDAITRIGDRANTAALRWQFWVNNEYGGEPGAFEISDGDVLLVQYVKPQPTETPKP
jgi:hypothetical protein